MWANFSRVTKYRALKIQYKIAIFLPGGSKNAFNLSCYTISSTIDETAGIRRCSLRAALY
ncbi:hypothetical protein CTE07_34830 [Chitinophaga terrae (ex Kim and Jung 2007)]|nr:hypothetical protein CTE07_34830 [Chitinophaga terrae (ex Kim and Jung 2007)]